MYSIVIGNYSYTVISIVYTLYLTWEYRGGLYRGDPPDIFEWYLLQVSNRIPIVNRAIRDFSQYFQAIAKVVP
jgi:hypothetical protein